MALIEMEHICKRYGTGDGAVHALEDVSFSVEAGEMVAILGRSGSGKSTLMNVLGCLDIPTAGEYRLDGRPVSRMGERELTALENVELPLIYRGIPERQRRRIAADNLRRVGLEDRMTHRPRQLSGGQQQRVAIARAMAGAPPLLLADEPTGNLDTAAGAAVLALLLEWNRAGNTVVLITHDPKIGAACSRRVYMRDGRLSDRSS